MSFTLSPEEIRARILHKDALMIILDKPPGLPVHAGSGGGPTLEASFDALRYELPERPGLAHRLDRDTSGCLVLGRTKPALKRLGALFAQGQVQKLYWAIVEGEPDAEGQIALPVKKQDAARHSWRMRVANPGEEGAQDAITDYRLLAQAQGRALLALTPRTGRTHQIRVHCAAIGCPLIGDWLYSKAPAPRRPESAALQLHARAVTVPLHWKQPPVEALAPPPPHMRILLDQLGYTV